jgi:DNA-binding MarR family transcriptional regulator
MKSKSIHPSPESHASAPASALLCSPRSKPQAKASGKGSTLKLESVGMLVRRVREGIIGQVESALRADGIDINHMQFRVITWLGKFGSCTASELARALEHDPGALTRVFDRLVEKGLARREPQAGDRRVLMLCLTETGEALWAQVYAHYERVNAHAVRGLSAAERKQLTDLLARVAESLETPL